MAFVFILYVYIYLNINKVLKWNVLNINKN